MVLTLMYPKSMSVTCTYRHSLRTCFLQFLLVVFTCSAGIPRVVAGRWAEPQKAFSSGRVFALSPLLAPPLKKHSPLRGDSSVNGLLLALPYPWHVSVLRCLNRLGEPVQWVLASTELLK